MEERVMKLMRKGAITSVVHTDEAERRCARVVTRLDDALARLRDKIRRGERVLGTELEAWA